MIRKLLFFLIKLTFGFLIVTIGWIVLYKYVPVPVTMTMIANSWRNLNTDNPVIWSKKWKPIKEISPYYIQAVIASEDQKFEQHQGFDVDAIKKAYEHNRKSQDKIRGGSTISQQTAKNVFLWQKRSWFRKGLEAYFTVCIEKIWGKERILEVYLNIAETGNGLYGVEAASVTYFKKSSADIRAEEAALVAAVLPSPKKYSAVHPGPYVKKRQAWILKQMKTVHWKDVK